MSHPPVPIACAFALLVGAWPTQQLRAQTDFVSLQAILAEAERASPRITAAVAAERAAAARVPTTTRPPDPQIQFGWMNYGLRDLAPMTPLTMRQLQVMQMVPIAGRLRAMRAASEAGVSEAASGAESARARVRRETATTFLELHRLDRAIALARESQQVVIDLRATIAAMHRAGEGQQADVLLAEVAVARMAAEVERMLAMRTATAAGLVAVLTRPPGSPIGPTATVILPAELPALDSLVALALRRRPELGVADALVVRAAAMERSARSELWPDITVGVQLADGRDFTGMRESMGSLMLGASLPVFARRRQLQMREEAAAMRAMVEADRAMLAAETGAEVGMAHADLLRARRLRELYRQRVVPAAEAARQSALSAYRAGTVPFMTVLDNQMTLNRYLEELLLLDAEEGAAWAMLEALTGMRWLSPVGASTPGGRDD